MKSWKKQPCSLPGRSPRTQARQTEPASRISSFYLHNPCLDNYKASFMSLTSQVFGMQDCVDNLPVPSRYASLMWLVPFISRADLSTPKVAIGLATKGLLDTQQ